jgi:hypothetical protein
VLGILRAIEQRQLALAGDAQQLPPVLRMRRQFGVVGAAEFLEQAGIVVEALAQAGGVLYQLTQQQSGVAVDDKLFYLVKIDNARFSRMIVPGDRLDLDVTLKRRIRNMALYCGVARVDGEEAACADILCAEARD